MLHVSNPLNIKEPKLFDYYCEIDKLFKLNNLDYDAEYNEEYNGEFNSTVSYFVKIKKGIFSGFITHVKDNDSFGGAVYKLDTHLHMQKEGFSQGEIENAKTFASYPSPKLFFLGLLFPLLDTLVLPSE